MEKVEAETSVNETDVKKVIDTALALSQADMKTMSLHRKQFDSSMRKKTQNTLRTFFPDGKVPDQFKKYIAENTKKAWEKYLTTAVNVATKDIQRCTAIPSEQHLKDAKAFTVWLRTQLPSLARFPTGEALPQELAQALELNRNRHREAWKDTEKMAAKSVRTWRPPEGIKSYAAFKVAFLAALANTDIAKKHAGPIEVILLQKWAFYQSGIKTKTEDEDNEQMTLVKRKRKSDEHTVEVEHHEQMETDALPQEQSALNIVNHKKEQLQIVAGIDWKRLETQLGLDAKQSERMVNRFGLLMQSSGMRSLLLDGAQAQYYGPFILGLCARLEGSKFMNLMQDIRSETDMNRIPLLLFHNAERQQDIRHIRNTQSELWETFKRGLRLAGLQEEYLRSGSGRAASRPGRSCRTAKGSTSIGRMPTCAVPSTCSPKSR